MAVSTNEGKGRSVRLVKGQKGRMVNKGKAEKTESNEEKRSDL